MKESTTSGKNRKFVVIVMRNTFGVIGKISGLSRSSTNFMPD